MSFHTRAFAAQDALVSLLTAQSALNSWTIDYGLPSPPPPDLSIWVDETITPWTQDDETTGLKSFNEGFTLELYIWCRRSGATAKEVRDEIKPTADVVADVLAANHTLSGNVMHAAISGLEYASAFGEQDGRSRIGVLKIQVSCTAHLSSP